MKKTLILLAFILFGCNTTKTSLEYHQGIQKQNSWENYNSNWKRYEIEQAKAVRDARKEAKKDARKLEKHRRKVKRIKGNDYL